MSRFMRLLVLFDLPTTTAADKRHYLAFRKFLLGDGYDMLQYSVYSRITRNRDDAGAHLRRLKLNLPPDGQVRGLLVTEKQYAQMYVLLGKRTVSETEVGDSDILVL